MHGMDISSFTDIMKFGMCLGSTAAKFQNDMTLQWRHNDHDGVSNH